MTPREKAFRKIARKFIRDYKARNQFASFWVECEGEEICAATDKEGEVLDALMAVDHAHLYCTPTTRHDVSFVYFIWVNDVYDCISDYGMKLEEIIKGALGVAETYDV